MTLALNLEKIISARPRHGLNVNVVVGDTLIPLPCGMRAWPIVRSILIDAPLLLMSELSDEFSDPHLHSKRIEGRSESRVPRFKSRESARGVQMPEKHDCMKQADDRLNNK